MPSPSAAHTRAWGPLGRFADVFGDSAEASAPAVTALAALWRALVALQGISTAWSLVKLGFDSISVLVH